MSFLHAWKSSRMLCRILLVMLLLTTLNACSSIDYFSHLAKGQFDLLWQRENVVELLESDDTSDELKTRLILSQKIRKFAENEMFLPVGQSYTAYTDLERPYVVWNVYAAPQLSFESYTWCYPFLGCLAYRGFYDEQRAQDAAQKLIEDGYEVKVGGVQAYSTLGFFDDPLLNTFVFKHEVAFVELLIHEISHRLLYIDNDTKFNENFATAVALLGTEAWYKKQKNQSLYQAYQDHKLGQKKLISFLLAFKQQLEIVYEDERKNEPDKQFLKEALFNSLPEKFKQFKTEEGLDSRYDKWVLSMNNASLSTLANYQELVAGFIALFYQQKGSWTQFYSEVASIAKLDKDQRHHILIELSETTKEKSVWNKK